MPNRSDEKQRVCLTKIDDTLGSLCLGSRFELVARDLDRQEAVQRAYRMLKREHSDENPMCWAVEGGHNA